MPKVFGHIHPTKETSDNRLEGTVLAFRNAILFISVRTSKLLGNTMFGEFKTKLIRDISTTVIRAKMTSGRIVLSFNHLQEMNKRSKDFRFSLANKRSHQ